MFARFIIRNGTVRQAVALALAQAAAVPESGGGVDKRDWRSYIEMSAEFVLARFLLGILAGISVKRFE
jgi:hypothetical protein